MSVALFNAGYGRTDRKSFQTRMSNYFHDCPLIADLHPIVIDIRETPGSINEDWCRAIKLDTITNDHARKFLVRDWDDAMAEEAALSRADPTEKIITDDNLWHVFDEISVHYEWWQSLGNPYGGSLSALLWYMADIESSDAFLEFEQFVLRMYREGNVICLLCSELNAFDSKGRPKCHRIILSKLLKKRNPIFDIVHIQ